LPLPRIGTAGGFDGSLGEKENLHACGPRHFLARFAVAKKKPRNKPLWLVECTSRTDNPLERASN
jgi:hypothetical protein